MSGTKKYFNFVRNVWKNLSTPDKDRMGELWKGYEQAVAATYQKFIEARFNISIDNIFAFSDERWLPHRFNTSNRVIQAAYYLSNQDLSAGLNLLNRYLIKLSWDGHTPIEIDLRTANPSMVSVSEIVSRINGYAGFNLASVQDSVILFRSPTIGESSSIAFFPPSDVSKDASEYVLGLSSEDLPKYVPEYPKCYESGYPGLVSVPLLRDHIREDQSTVILSSPEDYIIEDGNFYFKQVPPERLWGKRNLFNEEWPWNNFGFLMGIYQENTERYIEVLQGLWFAFWTGPRPENLKRALYLLFNLPTAPFDGVVTSLTDSSITVTDASGVTVTLDIPERLEAVVTLGQRVEVFQPLVDGIRVYDKVNLPGFIETEIGRLGIQRFLTQNATRGTGPDTDETKAMRLLEEYTFLPQISVDAFVTPDINLSNVRLFLDAIKPVTKTYLFQVIVGEFQDSADYEDIIAYLLDMDVTPSIDYNETNTQPQSVLDEHEVTPVDGLHVDTEGYLIQEALEVEVKTFGVLLENFNA